jgi:hypothetical protein
MFDDRFSSQPPAAAAEGDGPANVADVDVEWSGAAGLAAQIRAKSMLIAATEADRLRLVARLADAVTAEAVAQAHRGHQPG